MLGNPLVTSTPSLSAELHLEYNKHSRGKSSLDDWHMITRNLDEQTARCLLRYLLSTPYPPPSKKVYKYLETYVADAMRNPVICRYPYTKLAVEIGNNIGESGCAIPYEYVQKCMDDYEAFTQGISPKYRELWLRLPPARRFAFLWFVKYAPYGSESNRMFHTKDHRFLNFLRMYCVEVGINTNKVVV